MAIDVGTAFELGSDRSFPRKGVYDVNPGFRKESENVSVKFCDESKMKSRTKPARDKIQLKRNGSICMVEPYEPSVPSVRLIIDRDLQGFPIRRLPSGGTPTPDFMHNCAIKKSLSKKMLFSSGTV